MTSRPRIAHVTTAHPYLDNRIYRKECVALAAAGFDVQLVAVAPRDEVIEGVGLVALPKRRGRGGRMLIGPVDAWRALRRVNPKMIHVHDPELIPMAIVWRFLHRRPAVFDAHEDLAKQVMGKTYIPAPLRRPVAWLAGLLERAADSLLDGIVAATPAINRKYHNSAVALVQNFPWLEDFPDPAPPAQSDGGLTLGYVGGISKERGGLEMLRVVRQSPHAPQLVLAGAASAQMQNEMASDTSGRIRYLGLLNADRVPDVIAGTDAGLVLFHPLPNHLECQPTKLFEYMAAGKPFIASDFQAWKQLLAEFDCGYFIDPEDPAALAAVISQLSIDPAEGRARGARGRQAVMANFTFEIDSVRLIELTRELVSRPFPSRGYNGSLVSWGAAR